MHISKLNWKQVEAYLRQDDRCVLPVGSVEQHAYLSLAIDSILAEKVAIDAAEPLGIPVFPAVNYGVTPLFMDYPGTVSLKMETLFALLRDIIDSMMHHGFKRILLVNGHGGNSPVEELLRHHYRDSVLNLKFHNWWRSVKTWEKVMATDAVASHASWMENFPWTRLAEYESPSERKLMVDVAHLKSLTPQEARFYLDDGNYGGYYQRPDDEMLEIWQVAVAETRSLLEEGW